MGGECCLYVIGERGCELSVGGDDDGRVIFGLGGGSEATG